MGEMLMLMLLLLRKLGEVAVWAVGVGGGHESYDRIGWEIAVL